MTDNRTTELTAIERLRTMLDELGVEWRKWTKGQVETKWFVPNGMTEFDSHFCSASVSKDHREGPLYYKGYVISPQAAIEASLGKADNASANAGDICELSELRDLACDINAAEIIDHVRITHRGWTFDSRWLDSWHMKFDRIADELEQAIAATLENEREKKLEELVKQLWYLVNHRSGYGYAAALESIEELGIEVDE